MKERQGEAAGENSDGMRAQKDTPETRTNVDQGGRAAARVAGQRYRSAGSVINGREHRVFSEGAQHQDGNGFYGETHLLTSIFDFADDGSEAPAVKAPVPAKKAEAPKPAREVPGSKAPQQANRGRGGYYSRGAPRNVLKSNSDKTADVEATDPESGFEGERRAPGRNGPRGHGERGRGRAPRAPRGRGAAPVSGGHTADRKSDGRKSAHALPDSEKRVASGWGADEGKAELAAEVEGAVDANKEAAAPDTDAPTTPAADAPAAEKKVEEEEDNTKSYEEYLAEKAKQASAFGQLEGRQVEGTSDFVGSALKKSAEPEDPFFSGLKKEKVQAPKKETSTKKEKIYLEHEGRFAPVSTGERRGGARGGRGGNRGDRGERPARGTARGGRGGNASRQAPIPVDDDKAFPALGA